MNVSSSLLHLIRQIKSAYIHLPVIISKSHLLILHALNRLPALAFILSKRLAHNVWRPHLSNVASSSMLGEDLARESSTPTGRHKPHIRLTPIVAIHRSQDEQVLDVLLEISIRYIGEDEKFASSEDGDGRDAHGDTWQ